MLIQYRQAHPAPSFSATTDKPMKGRLPLSALCNNIPHCAHRLPESSRVTSPSQSSISQETSSPAVSQIRQVLHSQSPLPNTRLSIRDTPKQHLPSIDHFHLLPRQTASRSYPSSSKLPFSAHPDRPSLNPRVDLATSYTASATPLHNPNPRNFASSSTSPDFLLDTSNSNSKLPRPPKFCIGGRLNATTGTDHFLLLPHDNIRTCSSTSPQAPERPDSYQKRRFSSQTASRMCTNCSISQTRQWVRGANQSWLCHSCGQFWRKNGYARPRALWNRPTFKRSSRKSRLVGQSDGLARSKVSPRQTVSSSFLDGKKMIQWEIRLPPLQACSDTQNTRGTRATLTRGHMLKRRLEEI